MKATLKAAYLTCLAGMVMILGAVYAISNTDPHHWGFILGTALDYIQGRSLFSQVYVQYGAGQPILFKLINYAIPITYTSIGLIVSAVYAMNLLVLFLCIEKVSSLTHAVLVTTVAFLFYPCPIYPWPDFIAGLCLSLSCYLILTDSERHSSWRYAAAGLFLFLAFMFRNTYLVGISLAGGSYVLLSAFSRRVRSQDIILSIVVFAVLALAYLLSLFAQGHLHLWYAQNMDAAISDYGVGTASILHLIGEIVIPKTFKNAILSGLLVVNAYNASTLFFKQDQFGVKSGSQVSPAIVLFLALLGAAGMIQGLHDYAKFRLQNACLPLYIGLAYFLVMNLPAVGPSWKRHASRFALSALLLVLIATSLHYLAPSTTTWPVLAHPHRFAFSKVPFFKGHTFEADVEAYYEVLSSNVCDGKRRIVNLTPDSTIPYLCVGQANSLSLPFYSDSFLSNINRQEATRVRDGEFRGDEIVIADSPLPVVANVHLQLLAYVYRPSSLLFMKPGEVSIFRVSTNWLATPK